MKHLYNFNKNLHIFVVEDRIYIIKIEKQVIIKRISTNTCSCFCDMILIMAEKCPGMTYIYGHRQSKFTFDLMMKTFKCNCACSQDANGLVLN